MCRCQPYAPGPHRENQKLMCRASTTGRTMFPRGGGGGGTAGQSESIIRET
jgi:hypothetical protein